MIMEDFELKQMWQAYDRKLEKLLVLNLHNFEQLQTQKAQSRIKTFVYNHVVWIVLGVIWVAALAFLFFNSLSNAWFAVSVGAIMLFSAYATVIYIKHLFLISQVNIGGSITETQKKLASVRSSLNQTGRVLLLQAPFYCTWFITPAMYKNVTGLSITLGIAVFFLVLSIWMYRALAPKNMQRKWVRNFENSFGGKHIVDALEFLDEIEDFKKENL